jgi:hypothetical protein
MHRVLSNSIEYTKKGFNEAPFLSWSIIYLLFLSIEWPHIVLWLEQYGFITRIFMLSIIPLVLWLYEAQKTRKARKLRILAFRESRILPKHDVDRLKLLLPDSQIDLFEFVLLPSLSAFYVTFSEISQEKYYKQKFEAVCSTVRQLKKYSTLYSNQHQYKHRDMALTAFYFYRTLFNGAIAFFHENNSYKQQSECKDNWVLLKRIPAKLNLILGAQYWRLYEFWEAVYGDPSNLRLNSDIIDYFNINSEYTGQTIVKNLENKLISKMHESPSEVIKNQIKINDISVGMNNERNKKIDKKISDQFIDWVTKKINSNDKQYSLNEGNYIFISPLLYDASIFITEALLNKYYKITNVMPDDLKEAIISQKILDNRQYLMHAGEKQQPLLRLNNIPLKKTARKKVLIEDVTSNADSDTRQNK